MRLPAAAPLDHLGLEPGELPPRRGRSRRRRQPPSRSGTPRPLRTRRPAIACHLATSSSPRGREHALDRAPGRAAPSRRPQLVAEQRLARARTPLPRWSTTCCRLRPRAIASRSTTAAIVRTAGNRLRPLEADCILYVRRGGRGSAGQGEALVRNASVAADGADPRGDPRRAARSRGSASRRRSSRATARDQPDARPRGAARAPGRGPRRRDAEPRRHGARARRRRPRRSLRAARAARGPRGAPRRRRGSAEEQLDELRESCDALRRAQPGRRRCASSCARTSSSTTRSSRSAGERAAGRAWCAR